MQCRDVLQCAQETLRANRRDARAKPRRAHEARFTDHRSELSHLEKYLLCCWFRTSTSFSRLSWAS